MPRSRVMSFTWPGHVIARFCHIVPSEARSAFSLRAVRRELSLEPSSGVQPPEDFARVEWPLEVIEAYARARLLGIVFGASRDPRMEIDVEDAEAYIRETVVACCPDSWYDKANEGIPPIEVRGRRLLRRPPTLATCDFSAKHSVISLRWPEGDVEVFRTSVPHNRSAYSASAVWRELAIVKHTAEKVMLRTDADTNWAFELGLRDGISCGSGLRPSATLDRAHVEDLVGREIAAYLLESVLPGGDRRRRRPSGSRRR